MWRDDARVPEPLPVGCNPRHAFHRFVARLVATHQCAADNLALAIPHWRPALVHVQPLDRGLAALEGITLVGDTVRIVRGGALFERRFPTFSRHLGKCVAGEVWPRSCRGNADKPGASRAFMAHFAISQLLVNLMSSGLKVFPRADSATVSSPHVMHAQVLVAGSSGLIGKALVASLSQPSMLNRFSPQVYSLVRRKPDNDRCVWRLPCHVPIMMGCAVLQRDILGPDGVPHRHRAFGGL